MLNLYLEVFQNHFQKHIRFIFYVKFILDSWKAFKPISLTLALGYTTLGILSAYRLGYLDFSNKHDILYIGNLLYY